MGFCNTAFIVSTQASVGWNERGMATSSIMFMRMVGSSVGASVFGAIVNFGIHRRLPEAGNAVNQLMQPAARKLLHAGELARLTEAIASSVHVVYVIAGLVAVVVYFWRWHCRRDLARHDQPRRKIFRLPGPSAGRTQIIKLRPQHALIYDFRRDSP